MAVQVLHMDRNDYYGGAAASLNLNQVSETLDWRRLCGFVFRDISNPVVVSPLSLAVSCLEVFAC